VLIEGVGDPGSINHLGVEVFSTEEVASAITYLEGEGFTTDVEENTTCCYAVQDKVWVSGPDASRWEVYTVLADASEEASLGCASDACATGTVSHASAHTSATTSVTGASSTCCATSSETPVVVSS
jgi:hypothetical protein